MTFQFEDGASPGSPSRYEPRLSFTPHAWRRLVLYTQNCPFEIGGLGLVEPRGDDFLVTDILIVEQDVNDIATRLDSADVSRLIDRLLSTGGEVGNLRLWWHSHAHEAPFWSGVDEETIEQFRNDYMVSLVGNHELRFLARQDHYVPRTTTWVHLDRPDDGSVDGVSAEEVDALRAEIAQKTRHVPRSSTARIF